MFELVVLLAVLVVSAVWIVGPRLAFRWFSLQPLTDHVEPVDNGVAENERDNDDNGNGETESDDDDEHDYRMFNPMDPMDFLLQYGHESDSTESDDDDEGLIVCDSCCELFFQ